MEDIYFKDKEGKCFLCEKTVAERKYRQSCGTAWMERKTKKFVNKVKTKGQFLNIKWLSGQSKRGSASPIKCHLHVNVKRYMFRDDQESVTDPGLVFHWH